MTNQTETPEPKAPTEAGGQVDRVVIRCPICGGTSIGHFRMDSDWGYGGDWNQVNTDENYEQTQLMGFRNNERPNVECNICCDCEHCF